VWSLRVKPAKVGGAPAAAIADRGLVSIARFFRLRDDLDRGQRSRQRAARRWPRTQDFGHKRCLRKSKRLEFLNAGDSKLGRIHGARQASRRLDLYVRLGAAADVGADAGWASPTENLPIAAHFRAPI
jgi:hypothetical protein